MRRDIRLWIINNTQKQANELVPSGVAEQEKDLEDLLTRNPDLLMRNLKLVARQAPAGGGALDLLGIDENGRMIVFELKRDRLARDSVAQIIDYSSYLESLDEDELANYIVDNSGKHGILKIEDFQSWYEESYGSSESDLRPVRMMLVAFDADVAAQRMVDFLNGRGVAIAIQTYTRFKHGKEVLMVGHHDRTVASSKAKQKAKISKEEGMRALNDYAKELEMEEYWESVVSSLNYANSVHPRNNRPPRKSGVTYYQRNLKLASTGVSFNGSHSALLEEKGRVRITFFPISIHLCSDLFEKASVPFEKETPSNVPKVGNIKDQQYCALTQEEWDTHKSEIVNLAEEVSKAWERKRKVENAILT